MEETNQQQQKEKQNPTTTYPYNYLNTTAGYGYQFNNNHYASYNNYQQAGYWNHYQQAQYYQQLQNQQQPINYAPPTYPQALNNANTFQRTAGHTNYNKNPNNRFQGRNFNPNYKNNNYQKNNEEQKSHQTNNPQFNNKNNSSQFGHQKNIKVDKRDLPENNKFYCEVCDRGFKTEEKFKEHCDTHVTCSVEGCKFKAAEKLVRIHYLNFHRTGIDKKVSSLETPEEIQKYINERKKNFPSKLNLEKKSSFENEKSERGVALSTRQFTRLNNSKKRKHDEFAKESNENKSNIEKNEEETMAKNENEKENINERKNKKFKNNKKFAKNQKENNSKSLKKPTLLQRLLADEIRHERNILLQCVRYIVRNNFFDDVKIENKCEIEDEKKLANNQLMTNEKDNVESKNEETRIILNECESNNEDEDEEEEEVEEDEMESSQSESQESSDESIIGSEQVISSQGYWK